MIKCVNCRFNSEAKSLGEEVRLCVIPLPIGLIRRCVILDEKKYGCVLGQPRKVKEKAEPTNKYGWPL